MDPDRIRLLLVEDNPGDARLIRALLQEVDVFPFELTHVERLQAAVEALSQREIDAALLDLSLPDAQGMDTVVQALEAAPEIPIVVLTGLDDEQTALQAVRAGAQDYLVKGAITGRLLSHSVRYAIERARLERERRTLLESERRARAEAEAAVRSRDEVLGTVAHDLRNPLAAINAATALLLGGTVSPADQVQRLQVVQRSSQQMDRLIQDLLDVASIESGTLRVEPEPIAVRALVEETIGVLEGQAEKAGIGLHLEAEPGLPDVLADRQRILQVLTNLASNALRFTPAGGSIWLRARRFGGTILLSVADTGEGIPREDLPHLFDRLWQARHARRGGTGRGLAISKGIVEAHGGRIWAASEPGKGTTVFFILPPSAAAEETGAEPEAEATAPPGGKALRLLLVDDHAAIRHGLVEILRRTQGYEVVGEAGTGEEALALAERLRPDIVVMDLAMPGMGGIEATRQITASMPEVRVLALTAESEAEALMPVLRAGGSGFIRKTTAHEDLVPALNTVARDEVFLYPSGNRLLLGDFLRGQEEERASPLESLSEQERQLLRLAAEGFTSAEIGKKLFLSPKTVDSYRSRLMRQLGLSHRSDLVRMALRTGLLRAD